MTRGARIDVSPARAARRAKSMIAFVPSLPERSPWRSDQAVPIRYRLSRANGGKDPHAPYPADWSFGGRVPTCDCTGFVCWSLGIDRYQPEFPVYGGWVNTDSAIIASERGVWFEPIEAPEVGCVAVYGGERYDGRRTRVGHWGVVTGVPAEWAADLIDCWDALRVTHCSSSRSRKTGAAIHETSGRIWARRGRLLRYVGPRVI